MEVKPCNSYAARPAGTAVYRRDRTVFKVYFVDIYGREHPERFEWPLNDLDQVAVDTALDRLEAKGVGFVIAFPHIAKVFRWSPDAETLLLVRAFKPADAAAVPLDRGEGYVEFACLAEAVIAADEYRFWAEATTVDEYLAHWCQWGDLPVKDNAKLGRYWRGE